MTDQQQQEQGEELRAADIESGGVAVISGFENEDNNDGGGVNSPAAAYRDLYNRMTPPQQANGALPTVSEHGLPRIRTVRTSSTASSDCSSLADGIDVSERDGVDEKDDEGVPAALPVRRTISAVSNVTAKYDLNGKGFLDDAEKAMRALDTENRGTLDMHKVYLVMKEMQQQQAELHEQQKSFANLKKVVIVLACFSMVLALANLGTAFAAATLAKDTKVDADTGSLLAKGSGETISTVSTGSVLHVLEPTEPENFYDRRRLSRKLQAIPIGNLGRLGSLGSDVAEPEKLRCPHPALGEIDAKEVLKLRRNIGKGVSHVNIKYKYKNPDNGKDIGSDLSLRIEESNDDGEGLHIRCTRTFPCEGEECNEMVGQYHLAPEDLRLEPHGKKGKFGLYSCYSMPPVIVNGDIGAGGLGDGDHAWKDKEDDHGDRRDL